MVNTDRVASVQESWIEVRLLGASRRGGSGRTFVGPPSTGVCHSSEISTVYLASFSTVYGPND